MDLVPGSKYTNTSTPAPASSTAESADGRNTAFRPVEGGNEMQSGEKLLVEAYAAIWLILFAMVLFSWRRQKSLDDRMGTLSAAIDKARRKERGEGEG